VSFRVASLPDRTGGDFITALFIAAPAFQFFSTMLPRQINNQTLRPEMTLTKITTIASTSKMWINPPMV
jgi:hypothetical protein